MTNEKQIRDNILLVPETSYSAPVEMPEEWREITTEQLRAKAGISTGQRAVLQTVQHNSNN